MQSSHDAMAQSRVADVEGMRDRRSQLRVFYERNRRFFLSRNLLLLRFTRFLKGFHRAFYKSHPAMGELSTKVSLLFKSLGT